MDRSTYSDEILPSIVKTGSVVQMGRKERESQISNFLFEVGLDFKVKSARQGLAARSLEVKLRSHNIKGIIFTFFMLSPV